MSKFLGVCVADSISMHAPLSVVYFCAKCQPDISVPLEMNPACSGNEVQHLLRFPRKMCRYRSCDTIVYDKRQIPHACRCEEHRPHIAARHIDGHGRSRNRRSREQQT